MVTLLDIRAFGSCDLEVDLDQQAFVPNIICCGLGHNFPLSGPPSVCRLCQSISTNLSRQYLRDKALVWARHPPHNIVGHYLALAGFGLSSFRQCAHPSLFVRSPCTWPACVKELPGHVSKRQALGQASASASPPSLCSPMFFVAGVENKDIYLNIWTILHNVSWHSCQYYLVCIS